MQRVSGRGEVDGADDRRRDVQAIRFERTGQTLDVVDMIERQRYSVTLSSAVEPKRESTDQFAFPVDEAVRLRTDSVTLPRVDVVCVRDESGTMLAETGHFAFESFEKGSYSIEICAPMKLYLRVNAPVDVVANMQNTTIDFGGPTDVLLGARSKHKRPEATITTTDDPRDLMVAVSAFSSALKTTSPERSYPTLRGHPPILKRGERLTIPNGLRVPETGVRIEIPPEYRYLYVAAPLAFYLGAELVPAATPRLVTEAGFEYPLSDEQGFEKTVERTLKQVFLFDCVTRTEGLYPVDLYERAQMERIVGLNFAALYEAPIADRLETYLSIPYEAIRDLVPTWKLTTHVAPTPESAEMLPFLIDDLAIVRTPSVAAETNSPAAATESIQDFLRNEAVAAGEFTRSGTSSIVDSSCDTYVRPEATKSIEQAWVGEGTPLGASKPTIQAYRNRLGRTPSTGDISIEIVCNDLQMVDERGLIDDVYGSRSELPFDVRVHHQATKAELAEIIERDADFLHYIGHIDPKGFQCADGRLDASTLDSVGIDAFLLNACSSYEHGMQLIEKGAIGGIVTLADVVNSGAVKIGASLSRLLNAGFPLCVALEIAKGNSAIGGQYVVIGDGGVAVTQPEGSTPCLCEIEYANSRFSVELNFYGSSLDGMGTLITPFIGTTNRYFLGSGTIARYEMSADEFEEFISLENMPLRFNGEVYWSREVDTSSLLSRVR